jgi:hypothetical protein
LTGPTSKTITYSPISTDSGAITSIGYPNKAYPSDVTSTWSLLPPAGHECQLVFIRIDIGGSRSSGGDGGDDDCSAANDGDQLTLIRSRLDSDLTDNDDDDDDITSMDLSCKVIVVV